MKKDKSSTSEPLTPLTTTEPKNAPIPDEHAGAYLYHKEKANLDLAHATGTRAYILTVISVGNILSHQLWKYAGFKSQHEWAVSVLLNKSALHRIKNEWERLSQAILGDVPDEKRWLNAAKHAKLIFEVRKSRGLLVAPPSPSSDESEVEAEYEVITEAIEQAKANRPVKQRVNHKLAYKKRHREERARLVDECIEKMNVLVNRLHGLRFMYKGFNRSEASESEFMFYLRYLNVLATEPVEDSHCWTYQEAHDTLSSGEPLPPEIRYALTGE